MLSQSFLPSTAFKEGKSFYDHGWNILHATETELYEYMKLFINHLRSQGIIFSDEDSWIIQIASALLDTIAQARFSLSNEDHNLLETGHHVFNVFYQKPDSTTWELQFANACYLEKIGKNLSDILWITDTELMKIIYTWETIQQFTSAVNNSKGVFTAQFIPMDNIPTNNNGDIPTFIWYRKEFSHPNGGKIQVRVGMNGTGLSEEQKQILEDIYKLTNTFRTKDISSVHYMRTSFEDTICRVKEQVISTLWNSQKWENILTVKMDFIRIILEIANDIIRNSPFPLIIIDNKGCIECISPVYAILVWHSVADILKPGFFSQIYSMMEFNALMEFYKENGHYPYDTEFMINRGKFFVWSEKENNISIPDTIGIIPNLSYFKTHEVNFNTVLPLESIANLLK